MNKTYLLIIGIAAAVVVLGGGYFLLNKSQTPANTTETNTTQTEQTQPTTEETMSANQVTIQGFAFSPATITVKVGDSITWTNNDRVPHSATSDDGSFDTGTFNQGESKTVTFDKAGTLKYHCSVHPNMKATVVVEE